jgi:hypothetical protein
MWLVKFLPFSTKTYDLAKLTVQESIVHSYKFPRTFYTCIYT